MTENAPKSGLVAALASVQAKLPAVGKGKTGKVEGVNKAGKPFSYEYKYADLADVAAQIHPLLSSAGLAFIAMPKLIGDTYQLVGELAHESGESREGVFPLPTGRPQEIGSAITYGRRYLLCSLTGVVADMDDDGRAASAPARVEPSGRDWAAEIDATTDLGDLQILWIDSGELGERTTDLEARMTARAAAINAEAGDEGTEAADEATPDT
jgi:hypothetical protein